MAEEKVKLYGMWESAFSKRVEIALKLKGVEYEFFEENLMNKSPDLLQYNPVHKKIPVFVHGNKAIAESQVILEYIDETWESETSILPRDPHLRAMARFWARFIDEKVFPSIFSKSLWIGGEGSAREEALENMKVLEKELEGKRFFGGESIGFVDIVADMIGYWLGAVEEATGKRIVVKEDFPCVCKWQDEFVNCDTVKAILPPREKLVAFFRDRIQAAANKHTSN